MLDDSDVSFILISNVTLFCSPFVIALHVCTHTLAIVTHFSDSDSCVMSCLLIRIFEKCW